MLLADTLLWMSGMAAEAVVLILLVWRRTYRTLPAFFLFILWSLISDPAQYFLAKVRPGDRLHVYTLSLAIDSLFQFAVLFELSRSVLKPASKILPKWFPILIAFVILAVCAAVWPLARAADIPGLNEQDHQLLHLQQSFAILRILYFLVLAGFSQLLSLSWRDRELQIATGLGIYSMVSVAVSVLHTRPALYAQYHLMDQLTVASYLCFSLIYWIVSFAQQEAVRREFTPQMQNLLLALAGTARTTRLDLSESTKSKKDRDVRWPND